MSSPRRRNPKGAGPQLRAELVAAATRLVDEHGDAAPVSLRAVAAAVGVAPTAVYLHFADRDDLMVAVLEDRFAAFHTAIEAAGAAAEGLDPLARLQRRGLAYLQFAREQPGAYRMMFSRVGFSTERADLAARCAQAGQAAYLSLVDAVDRCVTAGLMRGPTALMANVVWVVVHGYADLAAVGTPFLQPPEELLAAFIGSVRLAGSDAALPATPPA